VNGPANDRCNRCGAFEGVRPYAVGPRCPRCTPAVLLGLKEPEELYVIGLANLAAKAAGRGAA
jgi:hypothetical protein